MKRLIALWTGVALLTSSLWGYTAFAETEVTPVTASQEPAPMSVQIGVDGTVRLVGTYAGQGARPVPIQPSTSTQNSVQSTITVFNATLNGNQEVPNNNSSATGEATVQVNADEKTAFVSLSFSGLSSNPIGAHIHGPAEPGANAEAVFPLPVKQLTDYKITLSPQQFNDLLNGKMYINVHTENMPDGEIRGQLVPLPDIAVDNGVANASPTDVSAETTQSANGDSLSNTENNLESDQAGVPETIAEQFDPNTVLVAAWGTTWSVKINDATSLLHRDNTTSTLDEISFGDPIVVIGIMDTSTAQQLQDPLQAITPHITATSIRDKAIQVRRIRGFITDATSIDAGSFIMQTDAQQKVQVFISPETTISINSGSQTTVTGGTLANQMSVAVTGLFNSQQNTLVATSVIARAVPGVAEASRTSRSEDGATNNPTGALPVDNQPAETTTTTMRDTSTPQTF